MQGVEELLKYYTLPAIPADFSTSNSSYTLSHMLRVLTEMEPKLVINALVQSLSATLQEAVELADGEDSLVNKFLDLNAADADLVDKGNHAFRTLIRANGYFGLLADFFYTPVVAPSKSVAAVLQLFCGPQDLIAMLGHLQRFCLTEIFILRGKVPRAWWLPRRKSMNAGEADKSQTSEPMEGTQQGVSAPSAESGGGESSDQASTVQLTTPTTVPEQATAACLTATDIQPSAASRVTTSLQSNTGQATDIIDALSATVSFGDLTPLPEVQPLSDTHDPALKNFRNWKFLLNQIPTCFAALFQGVLKLLFQRRISDPAQRKNAFKVVAELAKAIVDALTVSTTGML